MTLDNFRVIKLDERNFTFEEFKKVESKKGSVSEKWVRVGGYYGNVSQCLQTLKDYIIGNYVACETYETVIKMIDRLNGSIVKCKIEIED